MLSFYGEEFILLRLAAAVLGIDCDKYQIRTICPGKRKARAKSSNLSVIEKV
jgi:hypothetical protein